MVPLTLFFKIILNFVKVSLWTVTVFLTIQSYAYSQNFYKPNNQLIHRENNQQIYNEII